MGYSLRWNNPVILTVDPNFQPDIQVGGTPITVESVYPKTPTEFWTFSGQHRRNSRGLHRLCVPFSVEKNQGPCLVTLLKFNIFALEKWWLEDDPFLLGWGYYFQGRTIRLPGDITIFTEKSWNTGMREGKLEDCTRMYLFLLINLVKLWCDMGQEKWMTSELSSNAFSLHLKVCFSKELTNLLLVFHRIPFQAWHRTGIIKMGTILRGGPNNANAW